MDSEERTAVRGELIDAVGNDRVLSEKADLLPYSMDTYRLRFGDDYRYVPDFAVLPGSTKQVQKVVEVAAKHRIPLIPKGGGSNRTGMLVPLSGGIIVDTIRMNKVVEVSRSDLYVTVQPGITLAELDKHLGGLGLSLNQEQGSYRVATVGGSISTSGFSRKHQKYGSISNRVMSLEVVLADGRILNTGPKVLYTSTGYRLRDLFIGAEGTLGIITEATLRVEPLPESRDALLAFYDDFWAAIAAAQKLMNSPVTFVGAEAYETENAAKWGAPPGKVGVLYVILDGTKGEVEAEKAYIRALMEKTGGAMAGSDVARQFIDKYVGQFCGARATTGIEDVITSYVPMDRIREFYDGLWNKIMPKYGTGPVPCEALSLDVGKYRMQGARFFLPTGDGCYDKYQEILAEVAKLTTRLGGTISSCHGVGIEHRDNLPLEFSEVALDVMRGIKAALDPDNIMNPGKKLPLATVRVNERTDQDEPPSLM